MRASRQACGGSQAEAAAPRATPGLAWRASQMPTSAIQQRMSPPHFEPCSTLTIFSHIHTVLPSTLPYNCCTAAIPLTTFYPVPRPACACPAVQRPAAACVDARPHRQAPHGPSIHMFTAPVLTTNTASCWLQPHTLPPLNPLLAVDRIQDQPPTSSAAPQPHPCLRHHVEVCRCRARRNEWLQAEQEQSRTAAAGSA